MTKPETIPDLSLPPLPDEIQHATDNYSIFTPERVAALMREYAIAVIASTASAVPPGYRPVPIEPTDKMTFVGQSTRYESVVSIGSLYAAMIAAAPQPHQAQPASDDEIMQALQERDDAIQSADDLAAQITAITETEIGEHSSGNCPYQQAMLAADEFIAKRLKNLAQPAMQPLSDEHITDGFCKVPGVHQFIQAFRAGARFAETAHRITAKATE